MTSNIKTIRSTPKLSNLFETCNRTGATLLDVVEVADGSFIFVLDNGQRIAASSFLVLDHVFEHLTLSGIEVSDKLRGKVYALERKYDSLDEALWDEDEIEMAAQVIARKEGN